MHEINADRQNYGQYHTVIRESQKDEERFYINFRMTTDCCEEVLNIFRVDIGKENMRSFMICTPRPILFGS
jgi:hypothetical protein